MDNGKTLELLNAFNQKTKNDSTIEIKKNGFNLYIPKNGNNDSCGYFYVDSFLGHDCYAYDSISTHTYIILETEGECYFEINGNRQIVQQGDVIKINPEDAFYYSGRMKLIEKIEPNFKDENFHIASPVNYEGSKSNGESRKLSF